MAQSGRELFELEEEIRTASKAWRAGDDDSRKKLLEMIPQLVGDLTMTENIVKAFSTYFQLVNLVEEYERVRILRKRYNQAFCSDVPMDESIAEAIATLVNEGITPDQMQQILDRLYIMPVFTAHPTESRRRTIRQILRHISENLESLQSSSTMEFEEDEFVRRIESNLVLLWQSDETRKLRPTVMDEVRNTGLYFFEQTLFDVVPKIYEELESALKKEFS